MRIDAHTHGDFSALTMPPAEYVAHCRKRGIERIVFIVDPEPCLKAYEAAPDFVIPVPWVDIDKVTIKEINDCFDWGAKGIKLIDPQFSYGDTRYDPIYRTIEERGKVCMFHTGYVTSGLADYGIPRKPRPTDISLMRPAAVDSMARRHPELKILMAHFGNPWWEEAWKITCSNPLVHAELSGGTAYRRSLRMWQDIFAPNGDLDTETLNKVLFASDVSYFTRTENEGFEPYCAFYDSLYDTIGAPPELRERINRGTAISLFELG
jgi:predicted TIM-barrel fold metal-dependent hydrolase